jgi:acyl-CoA synthetase (AMP-forming)/AMP-acid ligase II
VQLAGEGIIEHYLRAGEPDRRIPARGPHGRLATGDLGWADDDGFVHLVGRSDDVINRGGEKLHPREIEDVLLRDPRVAAAAVVGRAHSTLGQEPVAFVTLAAGPGGWPGDRPAGSSSVIVDELLERCRRALAPFKCPVAIEVREALPTGPTGKVRRRDLVTDALVPGAVGPDAFAPDPVGTAR